MNILFITSEAEPFCKTGGLADVAGSLPVALAASGQRTAVLLPLYDTIAQSWRDQMTRVWEGYTDLAWRHEPCALWKLERARRDVVLRAERALFPPRAALRRV